MEKVCIMMQGGFLDVPPQRVGVWGRQLEITFNPSVGRGLNTSSARPKYTCKRYV